MKTQTKWTLALTIVSIILIAIPMVFAAPTVPIGAEVQTVPFESNPSAVETGSRIITYPARAYDGDISFYASTTFGGATPFRWGVKTFTRPSGVGKTDFSIGYVDIKILYAAPSLSTDDQYRWVYYVGALGPFVLQDWTGNTAGCEILLPAADTLARDWHDVSDGGDGTWTWDEIASVVVRVEFSLVSGNDAKTFRIYEIWLTVSPLPKPPRASPTVSIQPLVVGQTLLEYETFFVDVYAMDMVYTDAAGTWGLQIFEFSLKYNTSVLTVVDVEGFYSYWPWTVKYWLTLDDTTGTISASYGIDTASALVDIGFKGSSAVYRIYFMVDGGGGGAGAYSWLLWTVTKPIAPAGRYIPHAEYPGVYGTPPADLHLFQEVGSPEDPISTNWVRVSPADYTEWHLSSWEDTSVPPDGKLSVSDTIDMTPLAGGEKKWYHVESLSTSDLGGGVTKRTIDCRERPPVPEFPLGLGIIMMLAPAIPIVYLWRTRKKVMKK
jgi:hypothetical protein